MVIVAEVFKINKKHINVNSLTSITSCGISFDHTSKFVLKNYSFTYRHFKKTHWMLMQILVLICGMKINLYIEKK